MADAQYVIDVAASFKGEQTIAQMDALTAKLLGVGANADTVQDAVVRVSKALDVSRASTIAANETLAAMNSEYRQLEKAANVAGIAQEKAAKLGAVPPNVAAAALAANSALERHTAELAKAEAAAKAAAAQENALSNTLGNVKKLGSELASAQSAAATEADRGIKKLHTGLAGIGGPIGNLGSQIAGSVDDFHDLEEALGTGGAQMAVFTGGIGLVVAAMVAVAAAVVVGTAKIAAWAVGLADAARSAMLTNQAVEAMNPQIAALHDTITSLDSETGLGSAAIDGIAKSLIQAKVSAADLPAALRAASLAERALGQGGAQEFIDQIKEGKQSVADLAAETQTKLGGIVSKQMMSIGAQSATLQSNIGKIFGGLDIEPVLTGMQRLVGLFDANSASGQALKLIFESVFQPLINQADKASTIIEAFVLGFEIGLVRVYIAAKPAIKAVSEFFSFKDTSLADALSVVTTAAEYIAPVIVAAAVPFVALGVVIGVVVAAVVGIQVAIYAFIGVVVAAGVALEAGFISAMKSAYDYLTSIDLGQIGSDLIAGLVRGITAGAGAVVQAVTGAVGGAIDAAKSALGIHSPSKVFAEIGGYTAEGFAQGVDAGADDAQTAMTSMVDPPAAAPASAQPKGSSGNGGGVTVDFSGATFTFTGVKDAEMSVAMIKQAIADVFEGIAIQAGGAPA